MENEKSVFSILVRNRFGVLTKVSTLFGQRGCNIHSLTVCPTHIDQFSHITVTLYEPEERVVQIQKQLQKLEDVQQVRRLAPGDTEHSMALIQIKKDAALPPAMPELSLQLITNSDGSVLIQAAGAPQSIDAFLKSIPPEVIEGASRTGSTVLCFTDNIR